jgi:H+/Cl- antiporter ClcA
MIPHTKAFMKAVSTHRYGFTLFAFILAAVLTGLTSVYFMRAFDYALAHRLDFHSIGRWCLLTTPLFFLLSAESIRRIAPCAGGSGIPQVIFAVKKHDTATGPALSSLTSPLTIAVKVVTILGALLAGASIGREGPTVHIAASLFVAFLVMARRIVGFDFDMRSALVAGGSAGLAAAFNTPLAGVTFAFEELTVDYFSDIKEFVMMSIVIAAVAAKSLYGDYNYFGRLLEPTPVSVFMSLTIGVLGGIAGAFFSTAILRGRRAVTSRLMGVKRYLIPVFLAWGLLAVAALSDADVLGPGNQVAQALTRGDFGSWAYSFPGAKMLATLLTYWSGIAGGIFAPCLSIGAALGGDLGRLLGAPIASCAMVGMAAFLSGTIQAPITSFVIIFEMTGHHQMLVPIMLGAAAAFMVARLLRAEHLYRSLSLDYEYLTAGAAAPAKHGGSPDVPK